MGTHLDQMGQIIRSHLVHDIALFRLLLHQLTDAGVFEGGTGIFGAKPLPARVKDFVFKKTIQTLNNFLLLFHCCEGE